MSKPTFQVAVNSANADGTTVLTPVDVSVNTQNGQFEMQLPTYVVEGTTVDGPMLYADTLQGVAQAYEHVCDEYSRERLGVKAEPKLMLAWRDYVSHGGRQFGLLEQFGIGITEVYVVGDRLHRRKGTTMGLRIGGKEFLSTPSALLDDTPEVRDKYESLAESIRTAGSIFNDIELAGNPTDFFLKIAYSEPTKPAAEPVQAGRRAGASRASAQHPCPHQP
jgi:hypothetical protein